MKTFSTKIHLLSKEEFDNSMLKNIIDNLPTVYFKDNIQPIMQDWGWECYCNVHKMENRIIEIDNYVNKEDETKNGLIDYIAEKIRLLGINLEILWDADVDGPSEKKPYEEGEEEET